MKSSEAATNITRSSADADKRARRDVRYTRSVYMFHYILHFFAIFVHSRPARDDVDVERGTDVEAGDDSGSDEDDGEVVFNPPIASWSAAGGELDRQIQLLNGKTERRSK